MDTKLSDSEVRRKIEQQRGIGYATTLVKALIRTFEEEIEHQKENQEIDV